MKNKSQTTDEHLKIHSPKLETLQELGKTALPRS